jgi:SpoVK/Ycf46/Vps4 family AAA+-type ATPase
MDLELKEIKHPIPAAQDAFDKLIAIDEQKQALIGMLEFFFDKKKLESWLKKHHRDGLPFLKEITQGTPLIILEGDVGCGKTALAHCVATPLAKRLDDRILCFETPSNIRGGGRVGEISSRITEAFSKAKAKLKDGDFGMFIIDEADDLATDRAQNQAHHEDKAGLNVLIKQIDAISADNKKLAVILITNRLKVLDPAVVRRASLVIGFSRPSKEGRKKVFLSLLTGTDFKDKEINDLVEVSEMKIPYSFSDIVQRIGRQAMMMSISQDRPFDAKMIKEVMKDVEPSPMIK